MFGDKKSLLLPVILRDDSFNFGNDESEYDKQISLSLIIVK
jgi:hypothetical protein